MTKTPTRLVDVGKLDSSTIHLVETSEELRAPYLTLSHCWGQNANISQRTTGGNLEIPFDKLPRTFQDAVTVTRRLGFTYLWIDSLCIIQGDEADWEHESAKMASIYANGVLNLAASYSADSNGGLMLERSQFHVTSCCWKGGTRKASSDSPCWTFDPQSEFITLGLRKPLPLISRGWVLQENVLSPRTVHFLPGEIIWECRQLSARESLYYHPAGLGKFKEEGTTSPPTNTVTRNGPKSFLRRDPDDTGGKQVALELRIPKSHQEHQSQLYRQWYKMVTEYSQKDLTRSEDRLPAIWALAQRFQDRTGDEYCSGLWRDDLFTGLLFRRLEPRPSSLHKSQRSFGPSWSWASIECGVKFEDVIRPLSSSSTQLNQPPDASLQKLVIVPTEPASLSMGRTRQAELEISTFARDVVGERDDWNPHPGIRVAEALGISTAYGGGSLHSDDWRRYESLTRRNGRPIPPSPKDSTALDAWARDRTFGQSHQGMSIGTMPVRTDCYFGWGGARFSEEARWRKRVEDAQRSGRDKILVSDGFELDFDTKALAARYNGKTVLCLHIKGASGLMVEHHASSQTYRRIGLYRQVVWCSSDGWEPKTITLG
jgi:hypothetical protein